MPKKGEREKDPGYLFQGYTFYSPLAQGAVWAMALWILAIATAFSDFQSVRIPHVSVRTHILPTLQPTEQTQQLLLSLQSSPPLFAVRGVATPRPVAGKALT